MISSCPCFLRISQGGRISDLKTETCYIVQCFKALIRKYARAARKEYLRLPQGFRMVPQSRECMRWDLGYVWKFDRVEEMDIWGRLNHHELDTWHECRGDHSIFEEWQELIPYCMRREWDKWSQRPHEEEFSLPNRRPGILPYIWCRDFERFM